MCINREAPTCNFFGLSTGRAIRHRGDYSSIVLCDRRYARPATLTKLPAWIKDRASTHSSFGPAFAALRKVRREGNEAPKSYLPYDWKKKFLMSGFRFFFCFLSSSWRRGRNGSNLFPKALADKPLKLRWGGNCSTSKQQRNWMFNLEWEMYIKKGLIVFKEFHHHY